MILDKIIEHKRKEVALRKEKVSIDVLKNNVVSSVRSLKKNLMDFGFICEIKRKSPSEKEINTAVDVSMVASVYDKYASGVSVLTDTKFFGGSFADLEMVSSMVSVPVLCKDFIVDEYQIYEARSHGADLVLLIASVLSDSEIESFLKIASSLGMECLVEVHDGTELDRVLKSNAEIIGINNRDLKTFKIDINNTIELLEKIPSDKVVVSESGFLTKDDVDKVRDKVNGVLIGTALMKSSNIEEELRRLL